MENVVVVVVVVVQPLWDPYEVMNSTWVEEEPEIAHGVHFPGIVVGLVYGRVSKALEHWS